MLTGQQALDRYFPEVRARLIEIAAAMDRVAKANALEPDQAADGNDDRFEMYRKSIQVLADPTGEDNKAEQIQLIFSDPYPPAGQ